MPTIIQTVAGAAQFTGLAGAGLFTFGSFDSLPANSRVVISSVAYRADGGGNPGTEFSVYFVRPGGAPTERMLLQRALTAQILAPDGSGDVRFCGSLLPRDRSLTPSSGANWQIVCLSLGKTVNASVMVDYIIQGYEEIQP